MPGEEINDYIAAWKENYSKYCELKRTIPAGGEYEAKGTVDMTIRIGGFFEGVCVQSYHMPIRTEEQLSGVISDYEYARKRGPKVMALLKCL